MKVDFTRDEWRALDFILYVVAHDEADLFLGYGVEVEGPFLDNLRLKVAEVAEAGRDVKVKTK
jgi:hypothetical protein